ncbi:hypothetical protein NLM59_00775 [Weeksellaceae bacterium KMM 9724]|uniref:hypothetical protein n=1 Tax=Profundicola chukchiensis TaxID=2961959 RepID=UPI0024382B69|nr:hypothetical protein [Profundicola chukchiensis]MDG4949444.1 hypothetical protein [Profundicola chukchiensis]
MKKIIPLLFVASAFIAPNFGNAQNCDSYEISLNKLVQTKDYDAAYPKLKEALAACPSEKINFYIFGETILENKVANAANEVEKKKYANELVTLIDNRIKNFKDGKEAFWKGEAITYELNYGLVDKMGAYKKFKELFSSSEDVQKFSSPAVYAYFSTSLQLLNEEKLGFEEVLKVYFQTKKIAEDNIEMRSVEYGTLAEKLDSIQKTNPKKDLTPAEKQMMANAQTNKDAFVNIHDSMESILEQYTTCDNIAPMFDNGFEANKDSIEWLTSSYQALASKDCYDNPIMERIEEQYNIVWKKQNPQAEQTQVASRGGGGTVGSPYGSGARKYKAGNYSGAIEDFKKAMYEVTGTTRGDVAYYIALSYQKTGSLSNAVSWAKRAANYKPGWGAPYQLIASAFGASANACGNSQFEKLSTYWVAADYANKAAAVDSRSASWAKSAVRSYEGTAPNQELIFQAGKKKGDRVSISCLGGATTTVR